jgi:competence protein ComEC
MVRQLGRRIAGRRGPPAVLMIVGGLWCALWSTRWRLLGLVPIVLGLMLAPTGRRPDVLIGRGAATIAVRTDSGRLAALAGRGANFELARWLEHDGDSRSLAEVVKSQAFHCDAQGCTARVRGLLLALTNSPAALRDDCVAAAILVIKFAKPRGCAPPGTVIDADDIQRNGAHALYLEDGQVRTETVADARGGRPWVPHSHKPVGEDAIALEAVDEYRPTRGRGTQ